MQPQIEHLVTYGVDTILIPENLSKKLGSGKKLRIKFGIDPSGSELHLGHSVPLRKLKQFQDLGHTVIFLIGDYTGMIGDPTGKSQTRVMLTEEQIKHNLKSYQRQAGKILNMKQVEIRYNSEWYKKIPFKDILTLTATKTVAQFLQREDFKKRLQGDHDISLVEFLYPLMQGYDSVMLHADVEIGGTDQLFNLLVGRDIQEHYGQPPQDILTVPLLEGLDGTEKMSKSLNNYIGLEENPTQMYGKTMSLPDELIVKYFQLCTDLLPAESAAIAQALAQGKNPRDYKMQLAYQLVKEYYSAAQAQGAEQAFINQFQKKQLPQDMPTVALTQTSLDIVSLLVETKLCESRNQARRMIEQGAVKINEEKVDDEKLVVTVQPELVIQVGKRKFCKIK